MKLKRKRSTTQRFSKRIVLLCLTAVSLLMAADIVLCWRNGEQLDSTSVTAICGFWGAEVFSSAWIRTAKLKKEDRKEESETDYTDDSGGPG